MYPAWVWIREPGARIISVSYSEKRIQNESNKSRLVIKSPKFKKHFGHLFQIIATNDSKGEYQNNKNGLRIAGIGESVLGYGYDIGIIDDPNRVKGRESKTEKESVHNFFKDLWSTRKNTPRSAQIIVQQRVSLDDLSGYILENTSYFEKIIVPLVYQGDNYLTHKSFTSLDFKDPRNTLGEPICKIRFTDDRIQQLKEESRDSFEIKQQQNPKPTTSELFKENCFKFFEKIHHNNFDSLVSSWDLSEGQNSYSVGLLWGVIKRTDGKERIEKYLLDEIRGKFNWDEVIYELRKQINSYNYRPNYILIEKASIGLSISNVIDREAKDKNVAVEAIRPAYKTKEERLKLCSFNFNEGLIHLKQAHWNKGYVEELYSFPNAINDDRVDATTQFLNWIEENYASIKRSTVLYEFR